MLAKCRCKCSLYAVKQHESVSFSQAILGATESIKIIAALLPGIWNPTVAAKQLASIDNYSNDLEGFRAQIEDVKARAAKNQHTVRFAVNGFVIVRETEEEAIRVLQEIQGKADKDAVEAFGEAVKQAGASTSNQTGMWANSKFEDLVQYNDGFKTKLIGTKYQVADRIVLLKSLGVDLILTAFLHYEEEIEQFGQDVLPLVRQLEKEGRGKNGEFEIEKTGDTYKKK